MIFLLVIATFILIFILITIIIFSFPKFSPIPYFPSNKKDLPLIIKSLNLKNNQTVLDLGAGDGVVIFEAAKTALGKKLNTKFVALDINPILVLIMTIRRLFHPNKKDIRIIYGNMWKFDYNKIACHSELGSGSSSRNLPAGRHGKSGMTNAVFYLYISPWLLEKTIVYLKKQFKSFSLISYFYPVKSLKGRMLKGREHNIYVYTLSSRAD